jgi:hypothetical protein
MFGAYAPEEFESYTGDTDSTDEGEIVDAEFEVTEPVPPPAPPSPPTPTPPAPTAPPAADVNISTESASSQKVSHEQLLSLKERKAILGLENEAWKQVLARYNVGSALNLTFAQADDLIYTLGQQLQVAEAVADQEAFLVE